ncbi:glutathione S-transferase family protein [Novosphingobium colocasiae]
MANSMMEVACLRAGAEPAAFAMDRKAKAWRLADERLATSPFFFGGTELTLADIMMGFALTTMRVLADFPLDGYPNILAYLGRIGDRPAYQRAMARAEPGLAPKLT